jgi:heme-degrading monooxygenase HmoA
LEIDMAGVVTIVSARIAPNRVSEVTGPFSEAVRTGMPERRQTSLLRGDGDRWQIVTVWRSREDLDSYLASVEEPFARQLFRRAGGTPEVEIFEVVLDSHSALMWP